VALRRSLRSFSAASATNDLDLMILIKDIKATLDC